MRPLLNILPDAEQACQKAAELFIDRYRNVVSTKDTFSAAFSGGNTPRRMLELLSGPEMRSEVSWDRVEIFQVDERYVPVDSIQSNTRMLHEALLDRIPIVHNNIHTFPVELPFEESTEQYARTLTGILGNPPVLDLVLLGAGEDGHTASLFPDSETLKIEDRYAAAVVSSAAVPKRLTLTLPAIRNASQAVFLVTGESKAKVVAECLTDPTSSLPAAIVTRECSDVVWILDRAAAEYINT